MNNVGIVYLLPILKSQYSILAVPPSFIIHHSSFIMLSLYIHIPFCASKCAYCSFNSLALSQLENSELLITNYVEALKKEIDHYAETLTDKSLKTIYFWWGTPSRIGVDKIIDIIEHIKTKFDCEELAELSIELNPYPEEEVLNFVKILNKSLNPML